MLYYELHGVRGPYVLLVHGMYSSRSHWLPNLPALRKYARPVVAELYGHDLSPTPQDPACYSPAAYVRQFELIRQGLGVERWLLIGQSLGAALTLRYALDYPEAIMAHAFTNSMTAFADHRWRSMAERSLLEQRALLEDAPAQDFRKHPLNPGRNTRLTDEQREAFDRDASRHSAVGIALGGTYTVLDSSVRARIHENIVPSLLLVGRREERFLPHRNFAAVSMPNLEIVDLDAGHAVNIDARTEFDAATRSFFTRHVA